MKHLVLTIQISMTTASVSSPHCLQQQTSGPVNAERQVLRSNKKYLVTELLETNTQNPQNV